VQIYLVGGAVRDRLLGLPVVDRDYVVVGAVPDEMVARGYKPVGADFPVFLHPQTKEEYALARTERKSGHGYKGFTVYAAPDVTLEDDLRRRDLTINAMAEDSAGHLIDPFGGATDLRDGVLRHVSPAFGEDPVRILRVARFAARYAKWGFRVAHETNRLMRSMVESGEIDHLVPERVWSELERALGEEKPSRFFIVLRRCGALARLFPEIDALFGVPQPENHHPEVDTGVHAMMVLDTAARLSADTVVRFAALMHDLGKGGTPPEEWPRHIAHESRGAEFVRAFCERFRAPNEHRDLAILAARFHGLAHRAFELRPGTLLELFEGIDSFRKPARLEKFLTVAEADFRGREGFSEKPYPQAALLRALYRAAADVDAAAIAADASGDGPKIAEALRCERLAAISQARSSFPDSPA